MRFLTKVLLSTFMVSIGIAQASSLKNKDLYEACTDKGPVGQNFCYGFIVSAANAAQYYRNLADTQESYLNICFPANVTNKDLVRIYLEWIEKYPSVLERPAFVGVSTALSVAYSCPSDS